MRDRYDLNGSFGNPISHSVTSHKDFSEFFRFKFRHQTAGFWKPIHSGDGLLDLLNEPSRVFTRVPANDMT